MQHDSRFHWQVQPDAERLVLEIVHQILLRCAWTQRLSQRMRIQTATRFHDWIDHLSLPQKGGWHKRLADAGFIRAERSGAADVYAHSGGIFPDIIIHDGRDIGCALAVESVADFCAAHALHPCIEGEPGSLFRRAIIGAGDGVSISVVERHGHAGYDLPLLSLRAASAARRHDEAFRLRQRDFASDDEGFAHAQRLITAAVTDLGPDHACDLFFTAERAFWQSRNLAARVQKARQDALGLGWANHDHHTYRSSRRCFTRLIHLFELFGFVCRERFHPGAHAEWGAQVLEHAATGIVIFADVDMSADELQADFAHVPFAGDKNKLGTVGLWCALHGESFLQAGMHHLECQFDFQALTAQLAAEGIDMMTPFTTFPHLIQAFTEGERWPVDGARIDHLLRARQISNDQAAIFRNDGAIGSHLENLERNQGFKGFNQQGVDQIIAGTDPRKK